jgi:hypothetical protein
MLEGIFQPMHLLVILFIALLVFGPKKLPELGKGREMVFAPSKTACATMHRWSGRPVGAEVKGRSRFSWRGVRPAVGILAS